VINDIDKQPISGSYRYYELGPTLFNSEGDLNELVGRERKTNIVGIPEHTAGYLNLNLPMNIF